MWCFVGAATCGALLVAAAATGCNCSSADPSAAPASAPSSAASSPEASASSDPAASAALLERREGGTIHWRVGADGRVAVRVTDDKDQPIVPPDVGATLQVNERKVDLTTEGGALVGRIAALTDELTDLAYVVTVRGERWQGVLQIPAGGTNELLTEPEVKVPEGTRGPNGGLVEVVGSDRIEIVLDEESGELRAYLLDENLKVMPVGDAEITVGLVE